MIRSHRPSFIKHLRMLCLSGVLAAICGPAMAAPFASLEGLYEGDWFNDFFGSQGPAEIAIAINGDAVTFTVDMDGFVFGLADPDPVVVTGTLIGDQIVVNQPGVMTFGDIVGTIDCSNGDVSFTLTMIPDFVNIVVTGTAAADSFNLAYLIDPIFGPDMYPGRLETVHTVPEVGPGFAEAAVLFSMAWLHRVRRGGAGTGTGTGTGELRADAEGPRGRRVGTSGLFRTALYIGIKPSTTTFVYSRGTNG